MHQERRLFNHSTQRRVEPIFSNTRKILSKQQTLQSSNELKSVELEKVESIFDEANFHFPELVKKRLEQAEEFHQKIYSARRSRLEEQISDLKSQNTYHTSKLEKLEKYRDEILQDLDSKGALEEYNSIAEHIKTIEGKINELATFQTAVAQAEKEYTKFDSQKAQIKVQAVQYINDIKQVLKEVETQFRSLVRRFYKDHGGALTITTNSGEAKYLYDITPYIQKDASQGVSEVKIFCYDMLLFLLNPKLLGFISHDSRIFSGMDHRQTRILFKIALEVCAKHDLQYFVNINKNTYEDVISTDNENILDDKERKMLIENTVLELFDGKPENTLFGESFG